MKKQFKKSITLLMMIVCIVSFGGIDVFAAVDYVSATREVGPQTIYIDEEAEVKLGITGKPPVNVVRPNDVVLVLDKSGSMQVDNRFETMISSAKEFVDLFDFASHQVGVVDYSSSASKYPLASNGADVKGYIDTIQVGGGTLTNLAIEKAMEVLAKGRDGAQPVIVLLTDGEATEPEAARIAAQKAKEAGIVFYTIALLGPKEDPDTSEANKLMTEMATTASHHHFVLGSVGLMDIYRAIVKEIGIASAYDVVITETVGPQFEIVSDSYNHNIPRPTVSGNTLTWSILELKGNVLDLSYKIRLKDGEAPGAFSVAPNAKITYKDYSGAKRSYTIPNKNLTVKYREPVITDITPAEGDVVGGERVTIKGDNFRDGLTVKFGSNLATDVQVVDTQTITAMTPVGTQGTVVVTVTNDDRQKATTTYNYMANPIVTSIEPAQGPFIGGNSVKINGKYFLKGMKVYFDGQEVNSMNYYNNGYVLVKAPQALKAGVVDIKLKNPDGTSLILADAYTYEPEIVSLPELVSITPNKGYLEGGEIVTITGKNIERGTKVYFGDKETNIATYSRNTSVKVVVPAGDMLGKVDVKIENPDGKVATLKEGYEYTSVPAPEITKISPNVGELAGGEIVYIEGKDFLNGLSVTIGGQDAKILNYYSPIKIRIRIPAGTVAGKEDVVLTNPDGQKVVVVGGYEYLPVPETSAPEITKISPNVGELIGGELVYIEGKNLANGLSVTIGGKDATILNYYSPIKIRIRIPAGDVAGKVEVELTNPDAKQISVVEGYEYLAPPEELEPVVTVISAESGELVGGEIIYIEGENFQRGAEVTFGDKVAEVLNYYNPKKMRVKVPAADTPGTIDVTVTNPSGKSGVLNNAYKYNVYEPSIESLSAESGELVGGEIIYIHGQNFEEGLEVTIGGEEAKLLNYYTSKKIRVRVPAASVPGVVDVVVTNPSGEVATLTDGYEYLAPPQQPDPEIERLSKSATPTVAGVDIANKSEILYIHGSGFTPETMVRILGEDGTEILVKPMNVYNAFKIRFRVPADISSGMATISIVTDDAESVAVELNIN